MSRFSERNARVEVGSEDDRDTPMTLTTGEVRSLKRKAIFGPIGFALSLVAIAFIVGGIYVNEKREARNRAVAAGEQGAIVTKMAELEKRVSAQVSEQGTTLGAQIVKYDDKIAAVGKTANHAVSLASEIDLEPVTEQVALINGEIVFLKASDAKLAAADAVNTTSVATLATKVESYQMANKEASDTILRTIDGLGRRVEIAEDAVSKSGRIARLTNLGLLTFGAVTSVHIIGTKGQGGGN
jgi:hypothetical protein